LVGRGIGPENRDFLGGQVLRTWKIAFRNLHELLCAVEASWIYCDKPLEPNDVLSYFDSNLGPSKPGPPDVAAFGKAKDAVVLSAVNNKHKLVTALALAEEVDGTTVLYSGHADGFLTKWSLGGNGDSATPIWSKLIYPNDSADRMGHYDDNLHVQEVMGVAGIAVRKNAQKKRHRVYTWTHAYEGYPNVTFEERGPSKVKCWSGKSGKLLQTHSCDVGVDEADKPAHPSIATVVFCKLWIEASRWVDSMVVGLHCICPRTCDWDSDYGDFDIEAAEQFGEGNILPFHEANGRAMESWRDHEGIIQAMAVVPNKCLLSYSIRKGHGLPDAMILWDLTQPGVPLCRHDFWDPSRSLSERNGTRLDGVSGISVSGTDVLFCCNYGDRIAVVTVEDKDGNPSLELHGYGNIGNRHAESDEYHGRMAMDGIHTVMAGEYHDEAWIFPIQGNSEQEGLDRREGNPRIFYESDLGYDGDGEDPHLVFSGRKLAKGKVTIPKWGGVTQHRKKQKTHARLTSDNLDEKPAKKKAVGDGGPALLALRGKWLVAGFSNGTIARAPFLPDTFHHPAASRDANCHASCSSLPSDEWNAPVLRANDSDSDEDSDDEQDADLQLIYSFFRPNPL